MEIQFNGDLIMSKYGMKIIFNEREIMVVSRKKKDVNISVDGPEICRSKNIKFLASMLDRSFETIRCTEQGLFEKNGGK